MDGKSSTSEVCSCAAVKVRGGVCHHSLWHSPSPVVTSALTPPSSLNCSTNRAERRHGKSTTSHAVFSASFAA